ncbi:hypothetical protein GOP47_0015091 [Adiantum capillus-veneris]|uniref:Uncharacterized protein n=1 Tax=Adiantum capillus-veneris TaxID=13818 RepID=A0A9D4ZE46_ADICA|nr:hypothetical protein GOP47_0015090 [Adiantum capillus-veneris]KAI5070748.1 hypothetical protein GOP47_0015091 [Adiantum capillus-veneris]
MAVGGKAGGDDSVPGGGDDGGPGSGDGGGGSGDCGGWRHSRSGYKRSWSISGWRWARLFRGDAKFGRNGGYCGGGPGLGGDDPEHAFGGAKEGGDVGAAAAVRDVRPAAAASNGI